MKINSLVAKTALAAAIAGASFAVSAKTLHLDIAAPTTLANEIFGDGSETTIIQLPVISFDATGAGNGLNGTTAGDVATKTVVDGKTTIKLTLGGSAVFGEVYDDAGLWEAKNIDIVVDGVSLDEKNATVSAGGTKNDNQITITLKNGTSTKGSAPGDLTGKKIDKIEIKGLKAQQLKTALARGTAGKQYASLEVREDATLATSTVDNAGPAVVVQSIDGIVLTAVPTHYDTAGGGRARINVADNQQKFTTTTGSNAASDFNAGVNNLTLGTLTINRNDDGATPANPAGKEDGTLFDFTAGDVVTLSLSSNNTDLRPYGTFYLEDPSASGYTTPCSGATSGAWVSGTGSATALEPNKVAINFTTTSVLAKPHNLCAVVTGTGEQIPETSLTAELSATYFSKRYTESYDEKPYGRVLRNGCQITLFNVPSPQVGGDKAFIRFTNTSEMKGQVNAFLYHQDGTKLDATSPQILDELTKHATAVFTTQQGVDGTVYLGDVLPEFAATKGRSRIVLQGAFPSCEAMGLVRSGNGPLINLTSTTYNDGTTATPLEHNGTSNTTN